MPDHDYATKTVFSLSVEVTFVVTAVLMAGVVAGVGFLFYIAVAPPHTSLLEVVVSGVDVVAPAAVVVGMVSGAFMAASSL